MIGFLGDYGVDASGNVSIPTDGGGGGVSVSTGSVGQTVQQASNDYEQVAGGVATGAAIGAAAGPIGAAVGSVVGGVVSAAPIVSSLLAGKCSGTPEQCACMAPYVHFWNVDVAGVQACLGQQPAPPPPGPPAFDPVAAATQLAASTTGIKTLAAQQRQQAALATIATIKRAPTAAQIQAGLATIATIRKAPPKAMLSAKWLGPNGPPNGVIVAGGLAAALGVAFKLGLLRGIL